MSSRFDKHERVRYELPCYPDAEPSEHRRFTCSVTTEPFWRRDESGTAVSVFLGGCGHGNVKSVIEGHAFLVSEVRKYYETRIKQLRDQTLYAERLLARWHDDPEQFRVKAAGEETAR